MRAFIGHRLAWGFYGGVSVPLTFHRQQVLHAGGSAPTFAGGFQHGFWLGFWGVWIGLLFWILR